MGAFGRARATPRPAALKADLDARRDNAAMTDPAAWSLAADPTRRIGRAIEFHATIGSTNDRARAALAELRGEGLAVVADEQLAGRGRRGRSWASPPGVNLMVSVGLHAGVDARLGGQLGAAAALAVQRACSALAPGYDLAIRWPNDLVDSEGRKVAGLLIETALEDGRLAEAVIGIGINANWLRSEMPAEISALATSLAELTGAPIDRVALLGELLAALDDEVSRLEQGRSPVPRLRQCSWLDGRRVEVDLGDRLLSGRAIGLDDDGALLLEHDGEVTSLTAGEVLRVHDAPATAVAR
jgi:BirA family transcriptional regulator, biotin operon repressor / biotin---[acetyl-CoA-carboxylase] ligase